MATRALSATSKTLLLTVGLALIGAGLAVTGGGRPLLDTELATHTYPRTLLLTAIFCLAELSLLHVEVRRQAYSITLAGLPLALGLLIGTPRELIAARIIGSLVAFLLQRSPPIKIAYNLAAYTAEAAIDATCVHALLGHPAHLSAQVAATCLLIIALVDQLMSVLVIVIITWHQGALSRRESAEVMLPALLGSGFATTGAVTALLLVGRGALGDTVLAVLVVSAAATYRGYQILHRRHQALEHLHDFVGLNTGEDPADVLAGRMLEQTRALMRATKAELIHTEAGVTSHLTVAEDGVLTICEDGWAATDWLVTRVRQDRQPALLPRATRDPKLKSWLSAQHAKDAVIVPLPNGAGDGVLLISDRLGDTGSFTTEDQTLLQTLAGHLSMAVRGSKLLDRLRYEATHDGLTGLANRTLLSQAIHTELAGAGRATLAVLLLDLDRFKEVNDTLGHHAGDCLLTVVGERLTATLPPDAVIARLGGDEFAILVPNLQDALTGAARSAEMLTAALAVPVELSEATVTTRASIGVALATAGCTQSDLLRHADTAMYAAKSGGGGVVFYDAELDRGRIERLALVADLHTALERDEFQLRYQPKLDLRTGQITSVEALVRWEHPRLGLLSPDAFVPLAESAGLIEPLTHLVLCAALQQAARWHDAGVDLTVAVNLSARSVNNPQLPSIVNDALLHAGVPAHRLVLEITESSVMQDADRAVDILQRIAAIGVKLSLDDFGTGYSSLAYLQRLPVSEVKIDRSFVRELTAANPRSDLLVRSIIGLAASLQLRVVAEGVEDEATLQLLHRLGCDLAQGYYIARPETAEEITNHLATYPGVRALPNLHAVSA